MSEEKLGKIEWKRKSGVPLTTNDSPATIEYCESLGYEKGKHTKTKKQKDDNRD